MAISQRCSARTPMACALVKTTSPPRNAAQNVARDSGSPQSSVTKTRFTVGTPRPYCASCGRARTWTIALDRGEANMSDTTSPSTGAEIRPFQIDISQSELDDLRRRIDATRWPTRELVTDRSQGVQL